MNRILYLLLFFLSLPAFGFSQKFTDQLIHQIDSFANGYPQEKVFLHTDRSQYVAGETIWFNSFTMLDNKLSFLSKVIYVDLVGPGSQVMKKRMLPLNNGLANGEILIDKNLPSGTYRLNAYTLWMLNFPEFIFSKEIVIRNSDQKTASVAVAQEISLQFFPEGGELVSGLNNRVAFKAVKKGGLPADLNGRIINQANKEVAKFTVLHNGMGVFEFTPLTGERYKAEVDFNNGKKQFDLPASKDEGILIQVTNENASRLFVQLFRTEKNAPEYNELWMIGQMNNEIVYSANMNFADDRNAAAIPKKNLPAGIMQITIFNNKGIPLAERLAFVSNYDLPKNEVQVNMLNASPRKKNSFTIDLSNYKNLNASIAITNEMADHQTSGQNIISSLLLSSDLKGYIHDPAFYFHDKEPATLKALDLLLMTHGWRRFVWKDLLANHFPELKYPVESGISVAGKLTKSDGKTDIKSGRLDFITKGDDSTTIMSTVKLDQQNEFFIPDLQFTKTATIYYQGTNEEKQKSLTQVQIHPGYFDTLKKSVYKPETDLLLLSETNQVMGKLIEEKKRLDIQESKAMETVIIKTKKLSPADSLSRLYASDIYQNSDQTLAMDKTHYVNIWQYLQRNVAGLSIGKNEFGQTTVDFTRYMNLDPFVTEQVMSDGDETTNIQFFLNEVPVTKDVIETLDPSDLSMIKIYKGNTAAVLGAPRGAIAVYTEKGKPASDWRSKGFSSFRKEGYSITREFYNKDYDLLDAQSGVGDIRATLFWNPGIKTDTSGKLTIQFYNDDITQSFRITMNGIDADGKLLYLEKVIK